MSKASSSPTARLLQNSRLFSIPKPLPAPQLAARATNGIRRDSKTATKPYPTHQAIDVPYSSRVIGEWGLKRHLPLRTTTKTSMPVRILAQDTNDHVTDFESSGDLSMTLTKFHEMSIPVLKRELRKDNYDAPRNFSVYEDAIDHTDRQDGATRWKQQGPWLLGMEAPDLEKFLQKLESQKPEWTEYLTEHFAKQHFEKAKTAALKDQGFFGPIEMQELTIQRDHIMRGAQERVRALRGDGDADLSATRKASEQIMNEAESRSQELARPIEQYTREQDAIAHLAAGDKRVANIMVFADELMKGIDRVPETGPDPRPEYRRKHAETKADAAAISEATYEEVLRRFGQKDRPKSDADLEKRARELVAQAVARIRDDKDARASQLEEWESSELQKYRPDKQELEALQLELRSAHKIEKLSSELTTLIVEFLDLPGMPNASTRAARTGRMKMSRTRDLQSTIENFGLVDNFDPQSQVAPFTTHPGAGLGYLRSATYMENHPVHGPQARRSPILSRVVRTRSTSSHGTEQFAKIGTGGFVANDSVGTNVNTRTTDPADSNQMAGVLDPYLEGGNKLWMEAQSASVDETGRVVLRLVRPDKESIAVKTGDVQPILNSKQVSLGSAGPPLLSDNFFRLRNPNAPPAKFGSSLSRR